MDKTQSAIKLVLFDIGGVLLNENSDSEFPLVIDKLSQFTKEMNKVGIKTGILSISEDSIPIENITKSHINMLIKSTINKEESLANYIKNKFKYSEIFYIADDLLDLPVLQKVEYSAAPQSARREVKRVVKYIIRKDDPIEIINEVKKIVLSNAQP